MTHNQDRLQNLKRLHEANSGLDYALTLFGDQLAKREGYKSPALDGLDAVHFYLIHKFGWLPRDVRAMSTEDLRFVLEEEMHGFVIPQAAR